MSKSRVRTTLRMALWRANSFKCWYCDLLVGYFDLQVDHIIPEATARERVGELVHFLGLPNDFHVNSPLNLVPAHHRCNRKKSDTEYSEQALRYYFATSQARQPAVAAELALLERQTSNNKLLSLIVSRIETGNLARADLLTAIEGLTAPPTKASSSEPLVVCFGVNISELFASNAVPAGAPQDYAGLCDWLEKRLLSSALLEIPAPSVATEASGRNGETVSIRLAFWNLDVRSLELASLSPWEILEVVSFSEVYEGSWDDLFSLATFRRYHAILEGEPDRCPHCGSKKIDGRRAIDERRDEEYFVYSCADCNWSEWSQ